MRNPDPPQGRVLADSSGFKMINNDIGAIDIAPFEDLKTWERGESFTIEHANQIVDALRAINNAGIAPPYQRRPMQFNFETGRASVAQPIPIGSWMQHDGIAANKPTASFEIEYFRQGEKVTAQKLNEIVAATRSLLGTMEAPRRVVPAITNQFAQTGQRPLFDDIPTLETTQETFGLSDWFSGQELASEHLNEPIDAINAKFSGIMPPIQQVRPYAQEFS